MRALNNNATNRHIIMMCRLFLLFSLYSSGSYADFVVPKTRGFRNNNPGNIEKHESWIGLSKKQTDKRFATFTHIEYGIRAMGKILDTYKNKYHITSVKGIVTRWAPKNENNAEKYTQFVKQYIDKRCSSCYAINRKIYIIQAIIKYENGFQPFNYNFIYHCITKG